MGAVLRHEPVGGHTAIQKAEGDLGKDEPAAPDELATPADAQREADA